MDQTKPRLLRQSMAGLVQGHGRELLSGPVLDGGRGFYCQTDSVAVKPPGLTITVTWLVADWLAESVNVTKNW